MKKTADISQEQFYTYSSVLLHYIKSRPVLGNLLLALLAMSCSHDIDETEALYSPDDIMTKTAYILSDGVPFRSLDIFAFESDSLNKLDSYQRYEDKKDGDIVSIASRTGDKEVFVCANGQWKKDDWANVNSIESLGEIRADLCMEEAIYPVMTGRGYFDAGALQMIDIQLERISCEICIRSICCDFSDKSYKDELIEDASLYLINVNAGCRLEPDGMVMPERIINAGGLNHEDIALMKAPELIYHRLENRISRNPVFHDINLRCYPNTSPEESPGSPFTRLVLEGKIEEQTYYWSIDIGRENGMTGIKRNHRYIYDLTIRCKGSMDPDITVRSGMMEIKMEVEEWQEKENQVIWF